MSPLIWLKIAGIVIVGALVFGGPAYKLGHWRGHSAGLDDGRAAQQAADAAILAAKNAEIEKLNASMAPEQDKIAETIREAIAEQPARVKVVERAVASYPEFAEVERPQELHADKVARLEAIAGAVR